MIIKKLRKAFLGVAILTSILLGEAFPALANVTYPIDVNEEMTHPTYWQDKSGMDYDTLLMTKSEISNLNEEIVKTDGTYVLKLEDFNETYSPDEYMDILLDEQYDKDYDEYFINTQKINPDEFFEDMRQAISKTGYRGSERKIQYAVATEIADVRSWPCSDYLGYEQMDYDDEFQETSITVNEPFLILQKCIYNDELYYWGHTRCCSGWILAKSLAICKTKQEWLDAWKVDVNDKNFLVVTQDKVTLEDSYYYPKTSGVKLDMGTVLKLVPNMEKPKNLNARGMWYNYVVYLPTRDSKGYYEKQVALISEHYNVNIGYPDMTQTKIMELAFSCLGNRYGWGGMLNAVDCSQYAQNIYKCFGLYLPRNTSWQRKVPGKKISVSDMDAKDKVKILKTCPAGSMIYYAGHTFMYIGCVDDVPYCINSAGGFCDSYEGSTYYSLNSVVINPLTVKLTNGTTWLDKSIDIMVFASDDIVSDIGKPKSVAITGICNKANGIEITWSKNEEADGYEIYRSVNDNAFTKIKQIDVASKVRFTDEKATRNGSTYKYKIVAFSNIYGKKYISDYSDIKTCYRLTRPVITLAKTQNINYAKPKLLLKWKKNSKVTGYKIKLVSATKITTYNIKNPARYSKVISSLTKGKKYTITVTAYKKVGGKTYTSAVSKKKVVKRFGK